MANINEIDLSQVANGLNTEGDLMRQSIDKNNKDADKGKGFNVLGALYDVAFRSFKVVYWTSFAIVAIASELRRANDRNDRLDKEAEEIARGYREAARLKKARENDARNAMNEHPEADNGHY